MAPANQQTIVALGDSLYAGYQLNPADSYPAQLERALNRRGRSVRVVNAGVSGETSAAGRQRLNFVLDGQAAKPSLVMVGLGANDMLRGLPPAQTRDNLRAILVELKRREIPAVLTGMIAAPNLGRIYAEEFNAIYPALAREFDAPLVPFFLQPVLMRRDLLLADGLHPNAKGVAAMVAATVETVDKALPQPETEPSATK